MPQPNNPGSLVVQLLALSCLWYASYWTLPYAQIYDTQVLVWMLWAVTALMTISFCIQLLKLALDVISLLIKKLLRFLMHVPIYLWNAYHTLRGRRPRGLKGTAHLANKDAVDKAGMFDR